MTAASSTSARVDTLDATKGILVVFMVLYHSLNYTTQYQLAFRYLSFLPPSFILITGFLLSSVYLARYAPTDLRMHLRLVTRGIKLVGLFTVLNLAGQVVQSRNYHNPTRGLDYFLRHWMDVYFYGESRMAVFEILLPIAYLLLLAPALVLIAARHRFALPLLALPLGAVCLWLDSRGLSSPNLNLIVAGILGMTCRVSFAALEPLGRYLPFTVAGYAAYAIVGLIWGQPFALQLIGAVLGLAAIYGASLHLGAGNWLKHWLVRLGQYSLVAYIAQIGILQMLSHFHGRPQPFSLGFAALALAALLLTTLVVELVAWSRRRVPVVNGAYQAVFA